MNKTQKQEEIPEVQNRNKKNLESWKLEGKNFKHTKNNFGS